MRTPWHAALVGAALVLLPIQVTAADDKAKPLTVELKRKASTTATCMCMR